MRQHDAVLATARRCAALVCLALVASAPAADAIVTQQPRTTVKSSSQQGAKQSFKQPATIVVARGGGGVMIASEDAQALDEFERLLTSVAGAYTVGGEQLTIFYLKHTKAAAAAETLIAVFAGAQTSGRSSSVHITPDTRLNALVVQASQSDIDTVEELLRILDQKQGTDEVSVHARPRLIAVHNTQAEDLANILREVFQDRLTAGPGGGAEGATGLPQGSFQRPPFPQQGPFQGPPFPQQGSFQGPQGPLGEAFSQVAALAGGTNRRGGAQRGAGEELPKMSIAVDTRANMLVVAAPDAFFQEVKDLVDKLDQSPLRSKDTVRAISLHGTNSELLRQALPALTGNRVYFGQTALAARPARALGAQSQRPYAQAQPLSQMGAQTGAAAGTSPQAVSGMGPAENQGMAASPGGPDQTGAAPGAADNRAFGTGPGGPPATDGPQQGPFSPQLPGPGGAPGGGMRGPMGGGQPGQPPMFQRGSSGRSGAGPGATRGGPGASR